MLQIFAGTGALFSTLLIALGFKFYAALSTVETPVAADYYEIGSQLDRHLAQTKSTENRTLSSAFFESSGNIKAGEQQIAVVYREAGPGNKPIASAEVRLVLSRRATTKQNSYTSCSTDAKGECRMRVSLSGRGRWEAVLTAVDSGGHRRIQKNLIVTE